MSRKHYPQSFFPPWQTVSLSIVWSYLNVLPTIKRLLISTQLWHWSTYCITRSASLCTNHHKWLCLSPLLLCDIWQVKILLSKVVYTVCATNHLKKKVLDFIKAYQCKKKRCVIMFGQCFKTYCIRKINWALR